MLGQLVLVYQMCRGIVQRTHAFCTF